MRYAASASRSGAAERLLDVGTQPVERRRTRDVRANASSSGADVALLQAAQLDVEDDRLALEGAVRVVRREVDLDLLALARRHAEHAALDLLEQAAAAELGVVAERRRALDGLAVDRGGEVDLDEVAELRRAVLDGAQRREARRAAARARARSRRSAPDLVRAAPRADSGCGQRALRRRFTVGVEAERLALGGRLRRSRSRGG